MTQESCRGITKGGKKCRGRRLPDSEFCFLHAATEEQRKQWSAMGGRNSAAEVRARKRLPAAILTNEEILSYLGIGFRAVLHEKKDPSVLNAMANGARAMVDVRKAVELEERIVEVERSLGIVRKTA
jgi:hypothetical protein